MPDVFRSLIVLMAAIAPDLPDDHVAPWRNAAKSL
jgi:hypothetical protein